jgi:hypothetical protein
MRRRLVAGQGMDRNCNGENHDCSRDDEKGHLAYLMPHAPKLALSEGEPALRLHSFRPRFESTTRLTHQRLSLGECGAIYDH